MWNVVEEDAQFENWIDLDGNPVDVAFENLRIDLRKEVVLEGGPFSSEADEKWYEGYTGIEGPTWKYWYHTVAWPKALSASIAFETGVSGA